MNHSACALLALLAIMSSGPTAFAHAQSTQAAKPGTSVPAKALCKEGNNPARVSGKSVRVVDGDTIRFVPNSAKSTFWNIRMLGIDTPEKNYNGKNQGVDADTATANLEKLLPPDTAVELIFDGQQCDKYGRFLAYVESRGADVNREQILAGFAANYCIYPNTARCAEYAKVTTQAIQAKKSFWVRGKTMIPYEWRMAVDNRKPDKPVADRREYKVYAPSTLTQIDVAERLFFLSADQVESPWYLVE